MRKRKTLIIVVLVVLLLAIGLVRFWIAAFPIKFAFLTSRTDASYLVPDLTCEITDIRITAPIRITEPRTDPSSIFAGKSYFEIYYGYQPCGKWYDIPCENYPLQGILRNSDKTGYDAAGESHIVKIGPYLLIAMQAPSKSGRVLDARFS